MQGKFGEGMPVEEDRPAEDKHSAAVEETVAWDSQLAVVPGKLAVLQPVFAQGRLLEDNRGHWVL